VAASEAGAAFFGVAFLPAAFLAAFFGAAFAPSAARFNAQRFLVAATIAALPARLSFRFGFGASDVAGVGLTAFFEAAHLARCAAAILARPAALIFRRLCVFNSGVAVAVADSAEPPDSMARSSAIWASRLLFWALKPVMAAVMISCVSLGGMFFDSLHRV
jgi:hypothetical protein